MPEILDPSCDCLINAADLDWITLDSTTNTILVQTSNVNDVGSHQVVLMQSFQNFANVYPFATFIITIDAIVKLHDVKKPPYFEEKLTT
jgi:hypothetical protein